MPPRWPSRSQSLSFLVRSALLVLLSAPALASGPIEFQEKQAVLARVGGRVITADAFRLEMVRRSEQGGGTFSSPQQREALLEELVRSASLATAAAASGYEKDPEIMALLDRILADKYLRDRVARGLKPPTEAEVERFYEEHSRDYGAGERRRGSFILIGMGKGASAETRQALELRAKQAAAEARGPETNAFAMAAARHSDDTATRYVGGDMGWAQQSDTGFRWDKAVTAALFAIARPGDVAGPITTPEGFYVVRLVEKTDGKPRPLAAVKANIVQRILQERRVLLQQEAYDQARRDVPVEIDKVILASIGPPPPLAAPGDDLPPPLPGTTPAPTKPKPSPEGVR